MPCPRKHSGSINGKPSYPYPATLLRLIQAEELFVARSPRPLTGAFARNAAVVAMTHNQPSGYAEPSWVDEVVTEILKSA